MGLYRRAVIRWEEVLDVVLTELENVTQ